MTTIGDSLDSKTLLNIVRSAVKVGEVYCINMDESNGIKPKAGDSSRDKYFIVLGFDADDEIYGGVIINSDINQKSPLSVRDWHMPIKCSKYSFLKHDSFVDCSKLKTANPTKFLKTRLLGSMDEADITLIINTIKDSPNESRIRISSFGL